jgi:hypothetical protein
MIHWSFLFNVWTCLISKTHFELRAAISAESCAPGCWARRPNENRDENSSAALLKSEIAILVGITENSVSRAKKKVGRLVCRAALHSGLHLEKNVHEKIIEEIADNFFRL